jgi:hypothetical protein
VGMCRLEISLMLLPSNRYVDEVEAKLREFEDRFGAQTVSPLSADTQSAGSSQDRARSEAVALAIPQNYTPAQSIGSQSLHRQSNLQRCPEWQATTAPFPGQQSVESRATNSQMDTRSNGLLTPCDSSTVEPFDPNGKQHQLPLEQYNRKQVQSREQSRPLHDQQNIHGPPGSSGCSSGEADDSDGDHDDNEPIMDGMVEYSGSSPEVPQANESFGATSTFDFAMKIKASTIDERSKSTTTRPEFPVLTEQRNVVNGGSQVPSARGGSSSISRMRTEPEAEADNLDALKSYLNQSSLQYLPQRSVANALLDRYFSAVHPVWPFLIEDATRRRFDVTWSSDETPSPVWMAQQNLIFALACQFYESEAGAPLTDVYDAGMRFYQRGNGFVMAHAFNMCSIAMIQTLLLVAQYQQGTMRSNECWLTTGHATRMALGLGIHTSPTSPAKVEPLDRELRRRLWWGCFSLDR